MNIPTPPKASGVGTYSNLYPGKVGFIESEFDFVLKTISNLTIDL